MIMKITPSMMFEETTEKLRSWYERAHHKPFDKYEAQTILRPLFSELERLYQLEDCLPDIAARERQKFIDRAAIALCSSNADWDEEKSFDIAEELWKERERRRLEGYDPGVEP